MKLINLYLFKDKLYFISSGLIKNSSFILIPQAITMAFESDYVQIADNINYCFKNCKDLRTRPEQNYYKTFLKLSKAYSNINLVKNAKLILLKQDLNNYKILPCKGDTALKCFIPSKNVKEIILPIKENNLYSLSEVIYNLFNVEFN